VSGLASISPTNREQIDGLAIFAAAAFALGLGLIAALERVGAPDGFVEALGPALALIGLGAIGVFTRASSLPEFLAAGRAVPSFYGGLAFAAVAACNGQPSPTQAQQSSSASAATTTPAAAGASGAATAPWFICDSIDTPALPFRIFAIDLRKHVGSYKSQQSPRNPLIDIHLAVVGS